MQALGPLNSFLSYAPQLSGACFFSDFSHPPSSSAITVGDAASAGLQALCSHLGAFILGGSKSLMIVCCCSVTKSFPPLHKTPGTAARQASLSLHHLSEFAQVHDSWVGDTIEPSHPLSSPSPALSSIRVFSSESALHIRWPKYWSFSFSISPSSEYSGVISFKIDGLISLLLHPCLLIWPETFHFTKVI